MALSPRLRSFLLAAATLTPAITAQAPPRRVIGYFPSWGIYARNYHVPNIPAARLTHVNYAFANVQNGVVVLGDAYADTDRFYPGDCWNPGCRRGSFHQLELLKQQHPHLRTLISIGGWTWSGNFSNAVLTAQSRATFAQSIVDFVDTWRFDGADIDWEYPVSGGLGGNTTRPQDRTNFTLFLAELRQRFATRTQTTGKTYLLTIAAPANPAIIANLEVAAIHPHLDWINVMTYDFYGPWGDPRTGMNAPLHRDPLDPTPEPQRTTFTLSAAIDAYLALGVPADKLQPGAAFYGRGFGNVQSATNGLYAPYSHPSSPGTWEAGVYDYTDLAANYVNRNGYTRWWHDAARVPFLWSSAARTFVSYDDPRSIAEKAWFANQRGLGGVMFWELSGDRNQELLAELDAWIRQRPALQAPATPVALAAPHRVDLTLHGGSARAGRLFVLLAGVSGTWPGSTVGAGTLPLNLDWLSEASLQLAGGALFPQGIGQLDASGAANPAIDFAAAPVLPPALLGLRVHAAAWVFAAVGSLAGDCSNPIEITFTAN
ncbi:MAG: glycoside hydrolase family 18 protein [Planctomycetes bacterium]|nr:glycoside hydrolase family 18 protein [Planctomycetota bacterium]